MKKTIALFGLLTAGFLTINVQAQTDPPAPPIYSTNAAGQVSVSPGSVGAPNFFSQLASWGTTRDPSATTFNSNHGSMFTGADYIQGANVDALVGVEYKFGTNSPWAVQAEARNAAIAGVIVGAEGGVGYNAIHDTDMELGAFVGGGDTFDKQAITKGGYGYVKVEGKKALGSKTFAGAYAEEQFGPHAENIPIIGVFTGFVF